MTEPLNPRRGVARVKNPRSVALFLVRDVLRVPSKLVPIPPETDVEYSIPQEQMPQWVQWVKQAAEICKTADPNHKRNVSYMTHSNNPQDWTWVEFNWRSRATTGRHFQLLLASPRCSSRYSRLAWDVGDTPKEISSTFYVGQVRKALSPIPHEDRRFFKDYFPDSVA